MCVNDTVSAPSIRVTSPSVGHLFSVGETISIAWNSTAAPSNAVVQLDLIDDSTGELVGDGYICSANGTSGSCSWRIPLSAEICGRSTDIPGICGTDFKSTAGYKVRASLLSALMCRGFCQPNAGQPAIYAKGESGVFGIKGLSTEAQKAALSITANNATASLSVTSGTAITIRWYATYVKAGSCVLLGNGNLTGWTGEARWRNGPASSKPLARFGAMGGALARGWALRPGGRPSN